MIIRFSVAARLGEKQPMATRITAAQRLKRWLFGHSRPVNRVTVFFDRARRERSSAG